MILDSYAVLAFLRAEPAAKVVEQMLVDNPSARLTVIGVAEVLDRLIRLSGSDEEEAVLDLAQLGLADPVPLSPGVAVAAGLLRARRYHRTRCAISLADCVAAESARFEATPLATSDPHLLDICNEEGISVEALPDSNGKTWNP
ncbi:MAG: PIN domain-containing protein [Acidimicrobiales bacterium]